MHAQQAGGADVAFVGKVQRGQPADVPVPEQKLATEVALLDDIVIGHGDLALGPAGHAHHCKVLGKLAAQRARTNQENLQVLQLPLHRPPKDTDLPIVAASLHRHRCSMKRPPVRHTAKYTGDRHGSGPAWFEPQWDKVERQGLD